MNEPINNRYWDYYWEGYYAYQDGCDINESPDLRIATEDQIQAWLDGYDDAGKEGN
jgi:hypothetical protein